MSENEKPSLNDVLAYGKKRIAAYVGKKFPNLPAEHHEEITQEGLFRIGRTYADLDPNAGWKSFVNIHAQGAVMDYLKAGDGFEETRKSESEKPRLRKRISNTDIENKQVDVEDILSMNGVITEAPPLYEELTVIDKNDSKKRLSLLVYPIRWDLVSCMAAQDPQVHAYALYLRGFSAEEMIPYVKVKGESLCRSRLGQLIQNMTERFAAAARGSMETTTAEESIWFKQICYAFGMCKHLNLPDVDQSRVVGFLVGWSSRTADLDPNPDPPEEEKLPDQMDIFDVIGGDDGEG